jgi:hypothetical protein
LNIFQRLYEAEDKRIDIVSDIMTHVVKTKDLIPTPHIMIKSFVNFLEHANSNIAFQEYLINIEYQSTYMVELEKFQLEIPEEGFVLQENNSL